MDFGHSSPGAPCRRFLQPQLLALRLVNLVHGAVAQLTHQLEVKIREGIKGSGEEFPISRGKEFSRIFPSTHLEQLWLPGIQREGSHLGAVNTQAPAQPGGRKSKN